MMIPDLGHGLVGDGIGKIGLLGQADRLVIPLQMVRIEITPGPAQHSVEGVESTLARPVAWRLQPSGDVPLPRHGGAVSRLPEDFRECDSLPAQVAKIAIQLVVLHHVADIGLVRI